MLWFFNKVSVFSKTGGVKWTLEIDETVAVHSKYNIGGVFPTVWSVGEIQRGTENYAFMEIVENINDNT